MSSPPKKKRTYLAGPMTGLPFYNFPAFDAARDTLSANPCIEVVSPADIDREHGIDPIKNPGLEMTPELLKQIRQRDIEALETCDAIFMLDGWEDSVGARAELAYAQWCGCEVDYQQEISAPPTQDSRNPKDIAGSKKCPLHLIPPGAEEHTAWGLLGGAVKYGVDNWLDESISLKGYVAAIKRHCNEVLKGHWINHDSVPPVPHFANIAATSMILMDAHEHGRLIDDRHGVRLKAAKATMLRTTDGEML